jgi:hypothetical protein
MNAFLESESIPFRRMKKNREIDVDLRADVIDISVDEKNLELTLKKGSPFGVLAWLLQIGEAEARQLEVRKISVTMHGKNNKQTGRSPQATV